TRIREQLRNLNQRLRTVQEEEKQRIAREVHDELGQSMTALAMDLAWTKKRIDPSHAALVEKIEGMARLVEDTLERTQRIATELRPHVLDVMGLSEALQWQSRQFTQRTGIPCRMELDAARRDPDTDKSTALFRIFQETLTNVSRHAKASLVTARFHLANGWFELAVTDDGIGIPPGKLTDMASLGLMGIRERALALGGAVDIGGHPGGGSTVTVRIPAKGP
ncbi:MAG: sensor histidine kinase, partial [Nitrospinaceae bacterium]